MTHPYRCLTLLLLAVPGCSALSLPEDQPTLAGPIVARDLQFGAIQGTRNVHVRPAADECGIVFAVDGRTTIGIRTDDARLREGTPDDLTVGRTVRAWARGPILESCPAQATAAAVELLE